jgi:hypothetical protein
MRGTRHEDQTAQSISDPNLNTTKLNRPKPIPTPNSPYPNAISDLSDTSLHRPPSRVRSVRIKSLL